MGRTLSVAEAKAHFSDCVRTAELGSSVLITRRGKPVAALVPAQSAKQIERWLAARPAQGLASLVGKGTWSEEFVESLLRHRRTPPRRLPDPDE